MTRFAAPIAEAIWDMKYRMKEADGTPVDHTVEDTWRRVARALAATESDPEAWEDRFYAALEGFRFLPAGRILAGAGTDRSVTLFNCFVMGTIPDSMAGIFEALKEAALTMQQGGGIGYDFSTIRPKGAGVKGVAADASGPLSFMDVWDAMCRTIMSAGSRRGAMMAVMRCDHPDIEAFIAAKSDPARLRNFNVSVLVTDPFMAAVKADGRWDLVFDGRVHRTVPARDLWNRITRATYDYAEPGVIFIDRINAMNNLAYAETIAATNPCGEQPLPPYGACLLGSINLARLVKGPFGPEAALDEDALDDLVSVAVRMMDNVVDVSRFPLPEQAEEARQKRRIGLGVTGLADALLMVGARYGSKEAARLTSRWLRALARHRISGLSASGGREGRLPRCSTPTPTWLRRPSPGWMTMCADAIRTHGIRNALLTSIAPHRHHQPLCRQRLVGDRAGFRLCLPPQGPAKGRLAHRAGDRRLRGGEMARDERRTRRCPTISSTRRRSPPASMSGCRRRRRTGSIRRSRRPSTAPRTSPSRRSATSTSRPGSRAARAAPPTARTR